MAVILLGTGKAKQGLGEGTEGRKVVEKAPRARLWDSRMGTPRKAHS